MAKINRRARGLSVNPPFPWDDNDSSKFSLEEIALEFISWINAGRFVGLLPNGMQQGFLNEALEYNFPRADPREIREQLLDIYTAMYNRMRANRECFDRLPPAPHTMQALLDLKN
jgi:hypothetical protein